MTKDWRLQNLESQPLRGVRWVRKVYRVRRPDWTHDHCVGCWAKLMEPGVEGDDIIHEGYATTEDYTRGADYDWVCPSCYELFRDDMEWVDVTPKNSERHHHPA